MSRLLSGRVWLLSPKKPAFPVQGKADPVEIGEDRIKAHFSQSGGVGGSILTSAMGKVISTVVPIPTWLETETFPLCS